MIQGFLNNLYHGLQVSPDDKILLAVSGGVDSMVMSHLFLESRNPLILAHCNFRLRAGEADDDESFVADFCQQNNIPFYLKAFDTNAYASEKNISIQMAARELRYSWFEELRVETRCKYIATAHNQDDKSESFFINLLRGTGIKGLSGMTQINEPLLRPVLNFSRSEILQYARDHKITWREDSSNSSLKYKRNKIRHEVIPVFREMNPSFNTTMERNMKNLSMINDLANDYIAAAKKRLIKLKGGITEIPVSELKKEKFLPLLCWEILSEYNFSPSAIENILENLDDSSGKIFFSPSCRLVKDRDFLIIDRRSKTDSRRYYIEENQTFISTPFAMEIRSHSAQGFSIPVDRKTACLDTDKLEFPLILRKWISGDYFKPLGMENHKKISDFFIDNKFSIPQKENTWLLCSGENIVWVAGHRIDDSYKITETTTRITCLKITKD